MSVLLLIMAVVGQLGSASAGSSGEKPIKILITNEIRPGEPLPILEKYAREAVDAFTANIAKPTRDLRLDYDKAASENFFDPETDTIRLSPLNNGVQIQDVIQHEVFHALFCQIKPETCSALAGGSVEIGALNEALADTFTHLINPTAEKMGVNYTSDQPYVRTYHSQFCYSLAEDSHEKGQAILNHFVESNIDWTGFKTYLLKGKLTLARALSPDFNGKYKIPTGTCFDDVGGPKKQARFTVELPDPNAKAGLRFSGVEPGTFAADVPVPSVLHIKIYRNPALQAVYPMAKTMLYPTSPAAFRDLEVTPEGEDGFKIVLKDTFRTSFFFLAITDEAGGAHAPLGGEAYWFTRAKPAPRAMP